MSTPDLKATNVNAAIVSLSPYQPGKPIDELARELGISDIIKLASNENPRGPGEKVRTALRSVFDHLSLYPDGSGYRLKQALAEHHGVALPCITLGNGSNDVLELAARVVLEPGAEAIVSEHAFVVYRLATIAAGAKLVTVPAVKFGTDLDGFLASVTNATRMMFIANPNNPTGTWVTHDALVAFLDAVPAHIWVVLDEAYQEYVDEPGFPNGMNLLARYPNLIVTRTFSKIHGLASLRVGYAVSSPVFADLLNRINLILAVQPHYQKNSTSRLTQITLISPAIPSPRGALAIVTNVGMGCGGRGSVRRATWLQGGLAKGP